MGGPCEVERYEDIPNIHDWNARTTRVHEAERRGDFAGAAAAAKAVVRGACSSEHWWGRLAELQMEAGLESDAVATLDALYRRRSNTVDRKLRDPESPLHRLTTDERLSKLGLGLRLGGGPPGAGGTAGAVDRAARRDVGAGED